MLRKLAPLARQALLYRPSAGFCLNKAYLDPRRHNTMNHNIHNVYIELYDTGEYPEWIVQQSEPKKTYESQAYSLIVDALKADHPGISVEYLTKNSYRSWDDALRRLYPDRKLKEGQKTFQQLINGVINKLTFNIVVKESKWTWIREQEERLQFTTRFFRTYSVESVEEFLQAYNLCIETLINLSNFGKAKDIPHDYSHLEKAFIAESRNEDPVGIKQLEENPNIINRIMAFIHKV